MEYRIVWDQMEPCPYREGQVARLPLRLPLEPVSSEAFDALLEEGDRRSGRLLYRTRCPECDACKPLRVPVARFTPTKSHRRVLRKNEDVQVRVANPAVSAERLRLYNKHKLQRGLSRDGQELAASGYRAWLVDSCTRSRELHYLVAGRLIGVSVLDFGRRSVSSVYHYFDPEESRRSIGVYSVLKELELCKKYDFEWYYLGFYVDDCAHLNYKAEYLPHQRKIDGRWVDFEAPAVQSPASSIG